MIWSSPVDLEEIGHINSQLAALFEMKALRDRHYFLGIETLDLNPQRHIDRPTPLCVEYALQIRHDGLQIRHDFSRQEHHASPWIGDGFRCDTVPTDCRKPHLLDD